MLTSLRRDEHPAMKGLGPSEHHAGHSIQIKKDSSEPAAKAQRAQWGENAFWQPFHRFLGDGAF